MWLCVPKLVGTRDSCVCGFVLPCLQVSSRRILTYVYMCLYVCPLWVSKYDSVCESSIVRVCPHISECEHVYVSPRVRKS